MWNGLRILTVAAVGVVLVTSSVSLGDDVSWGRAMVDKTMLHIDFASVARGQHVEFKIPVTNVYKEVIEITSLSTSAGSIFWDQGMQSPQLPQIISSGKKAVVILRLDTVRFQGELRDAQAKLTFTEPSKGTSDTTTVLVRGNIRNDLELIPGVVDFGSVDPQAEADQRFSINYTGPKNWKLVTAKSDSPHLATEIVEKARGHGMVTYEVIVKLKHTAPVAKFHDQIILATNDPTLLEIPVPIHARVEPEYVTSDANFGNLIPGQSKTIGVIIRYSKSPSVKFKIEKIVSTNRESRIKTKFSDGSTPLHMIHLALETPDIPGSFEEELAVTISGRDEKLIFKIKGFVRSPEASERK